MGAPARPLLTVAEVAAALAVDPATVRRLVARGELPAYRVGRALRVAPEDVERYLCQTRLHVPRAVDAPAPTGRTCSGGVASGTSVRPVSAGGSRSTLRTAPRRSAGCPPPSQPSGADPWQALRQRLRSPQP